jgi:DNA polymerase-3 subunit gamma/tau
MSYLVLARKYRPKTFAEMVGQEHVVQALGNALRARRLHHAYLFTGTRGVGKTTVSRILAKSLNCTGPDGRGDITDTPCGVCDACREIDAGRFVDYTELDAASNRGVDEVQALLEQAVYKPVQGRFKVFMIDEVHMLTNTAFNAMLKTLEEPPEYLKFVLATTDPQKVPVTVLSRCLQFNLRPMAPETVAQHLQQVLAREGIAAEPGAVRLLARAARGSMRDALSLTDQAIAFGAGRLAEADVRQMLGAVDHGYVLGLLHALSARDARALVAAVDDLRGQGLPPAATLEEMTAILQRLAVLQWTGEAAVDDADDARLPALAAALPADVTQLLYSLCLHGRAELGLAPDEYAALTMVLLRALAFMGEPPPLVVAPVASEAPAEKKTPPAPPLALEPAAAVAQTLVGPAVDSPPLGDEWERIVLALEAGGHVQALARELALQSELVDRQAHAWRLRVPQGTLAQDTPRERLRVALAQYLGLPEGWQLAVEVGPAPDSPAQRRAAARQARQQAAEAAIQGDPLVQSLMRDWGATIVPGSIHPVDGDPAV